MGRIGRSYPRFQPLQAQEEPAHERRSASQVLAAVIGLLAALGFIGWLLTR
jgi:hypothetical protein